MTEETFYNYFTKFGPVEDYIVFRDQQTGRTKGFGFVVFREASSAEAVVQQNGSHNVNGKNIDCKMST